jgi:hypothetical protein
VRSTTATAHTASSPGDTMALPVRDALAALPVQTESRTGYERTKFRHWTEADRDGCSTRDEVLLQEAVTTPEQDASCRLTGGSWYPPYDDTYLTAARTLDIDHLAPLTEAWDPDASTWTTGFGRECWLWSNSCGAATARDRSVRGPPRSVGLRGATERRRHCPPGRSAVPICLGAHTAAERARLMSAYSLMCSGAYG